MSLCTEAHGARWDLMTHKKFVVHDDRGNRILIIGRRSYYAPSVPFMSAHSPESGKIREHRVSAAAACFRALVVSRHREHRGRRRRDEIVGFEIIRVVPLVRGIRDLRIRIEGPE